MCKSIKLTIVTIFCLAIAVLAFFVAFESTEVAYADEDYFYVPQEPQNKIAVSSTIEFSNTDGTGLFYIPESYYIKFLGDNSDSISVSYMGLEGTIKKNLGLDKKSITAISKKTITESNAYPNIQLTTSEENISYTNMNDVETSVAANTVKVYFMGEAKDGTNIYIKFVTDDSTFYGYTNKSIFGSYTLSANQEVIDAIDKANTSPIAKSTNTNNSKALRVVLIIGLIIPAVVIALLIFIPKKSEQYDKARMHGNKTTFIDYDKTRSTEQQNQEAQGQNQGYAPNYQQPQNNGYYPPQQNNYYPPQQNNGYYPPQNGGYYAPQPPQQYPYQQQGYYPPQDNGGYPPYDDGNNGQY